MKPIKIHKKIEYNDYRKTLQKQIKEEGYEEILIRIAWNVSKLLNQERKRQKTDV